MGKLQSAKSVMLNFSDFYQINSKNSSDSSETIIAEVAGKDSIAAILQVAKKSSIKKLVGIGINHRSFYGNIDEPTEHFEYISNDKALLNIKKTEFMYLDVSSLFDLLIVRTLAIVQKHFHYFSPCPACHLFFHMMRVPIAHHLKVAKFITGERDIHGTRKKLNQLPEVLDLLKILLEKEGINLIQPLKSITKDEEIFTLLGKKWVSALPYKCSFSGNYYDENGKIPFNTTNVLNSLSNFYYPLFHETIHYIELHKNEPDWNWIEKTLLDIIEEF
ncbi:hypothetical protein [Candidatus Lokiarchaeum ossiferum]|uniref:hypothetical protein n=1 Tax=Candidatus Lokiarchaeum ossiferum TaxID=2951803 RepID=UPI00352EF50F